MTRTTAQLRRDAVAIWQAGLEAVRSERLIADSVEVQRRRLLVGDLEFDLDTIGRIAIVGAGKAGAGMAGALERVLGPEILREKQVAGLVNVPADCVRSLAAVEVHAARPAGLNEPTAEGVAGTEKILQLLDELQPADLCFVLVSGGGSALLPAPVAGVPLADKIELTRFLSAAGADIIALNTVRKALSRVKGGRLASRCRAGTLVSLIISDVLGDPLDVIASGPTVPSTSTVADARAVLQRFGARRAGVAPQAIEYLERAQSETVPPPTCQVYNVVIGNNALAVDAAGCAAERLGYSHAMTAATGPEGAAEEVGRQLARMARSMQAGRGPDCLISGGEPTVTLIDAERRGRGGRNQQLVLAALAELAPTAPTGVALVSGGTDGEDGPTDAAGAWLDDDVVARVAARGLDAADSLARNDAYTFFQRCEALLKTGPTHTNVCDLRVVVVDRQELGTADR